MEVVGNGGRELLLVCDAIEDGTPWKGFGRRRDSECGGHQPRRRGGGGKEIRGEEQRQHSTAQTNNGLGQGE